LSSTASTATTRSAAIDAAAFARYCTPIHQADGYAYHNGAAALSSQA